MSSENTTPTAPNTCAEHLTIVEFAKAAGVTVRTVQRWHDNGKIRIWTIDGFPVVPSYELAKVKRKGTRTS